MTELCNWHDTITRYDLSPSIEPTGIIHMSEWLILSTPLVYCTVVWYSSKPVDLWLNHLILVYLPLYIHYPWASESAQIPFDRKVRDYRHHQQSKVRVQVESSPLARFFSMEAFFSNTLAVSQVVYWVFYSLFSLRESLVVILLTRYSRTPVLELSTLSLSLCTRWLTFLSTLL